MITHMTIGIRILLASPLGHVVAGPLRAAFSEDVTVVVTRDRDEFVSSIAGRVRFDVVAADLVWNRPDVEWHFDGLDVIDSLHASNRMAPILLATQGHTLEQDYLEEARLRPEVCGVVAKSDGLPQLTTAIRQVALGQRIKADIPTSRAPLYEMFAGRRGITAARLAGAIASGNATDNAGLAVAAKVSPNTANKVATHYLGPIMRKRGECDDRMPLTQAAVYRWCGLHARYITSWCRRHGHTDVLSENFH